MSNAYIEFKNISKTFFNESTNVNVLENFSKCFERACFYGITGKSGCGKTTFLRLLGGFEKPDSGLILVNGKEITRPGKDRIMIFQSFDQLFPWLTVRGNIVKAIKEVSGIKHPESDVYEEINDLLKRAGLFEFGQCYPYELSGGMKQRALLIRALCLKPDIMLLDEPFSALDKKTGDEMCMLIKEKFHKTAFLVSHDSKQTESFATGGIINFEDIRAI